MKFDINNYEGNYVMHCKTKEFTKADLKTGDVVMFRDESVGIINRDLQMIIHKESWTDLDHINEDLTHTHSKKFDIVAVRRPTERYECGFAAFCCRWGDLVYEEAEEMTLDEVCELLGKRIKIIQ